MFCGKGVLVLVPVLSWIALIQSQPFLAFDKHEPTCDPDVVPQNIIVKPSNPLLVLTTLLNLSKFQKQWPSNAEHRILVLLDINELNVTHQESVFALVRQGHTVALSTDTTKARDIDSELVTNLGVFESFMGFIPPFYFSKLPITNVTVPSFHLQLSSFPVSSNILQNQAALDFVLRHQHGSQVSASVLDLLTEPQLLCLLSRLECHLVSPSDPLFRFCLSTTKYLIPKTNVPNEMRKFLPLRKYERGPNMEAAPSFMDKRKSITKVVRISMEQIPERQVRALLFHPDFSMNLYRSDSRSTRMFASLLAKFGKCCKMISILLYFAAALDFLYHNFAWQLINKCELICRRQIDPLFFRTVGNRAKLV